MSRHIALGLLLLCALACGNDPAPAGSSAVDTGAADGGTGDAASADTGSADASGPSDTSLSDAALGDTVHADAGLSDAALADAAAPGPLQPDPAPTAAMAPVPGELSIHQLDLPMGLLGKLGEAAILIGPDGTLALLDIGNNKHADEVREAVEHLNKTLLTPARGYPRQRGAREVEWVVLTHNHGDHMGAAEELLSGKGALQITRGVVHRGHVDLSDAANLGRWEELCGALAKLPKAKVFALCAAAKTPPCDEGKLAGKYPATGCPGLRLGRLDDASDDKPQGKGAPSWLPLGGGARLTFIAADGRCTGAGESEASLSIGYSDNNEENGRSLVGLVSYGAFRYHFGGDLTGTGAKGEPDVESLVAKTAGPRFWGKDGVDVVHAHHHARKTSSNTTIVAALCPKDGHARNVVAGVNRAYLGSPNDAVVQRFAGGGRLAGGRFWTTASPVGGAKTKDEPSVVVAEGEVRVRTFAKGQGYRVQAWGDGSKQSLPFASVRSGQALATP